MRAGLISVCSRPGCGNAQPCSLHPKKEYERNTDTSERDKFYKSARWLKLRSWFMALEPEENPGLRCGPVCWGCKGNGLIRRATEVDHIVPIAEGGSPTEPENLQSLCKPCHSAKTRTEMNKNRMVF